MEKLAIETQVEEVAQQAGSLLRSRYALWILASISFVESALPVPFITDPFLIAYIIADRKVAYKAVLVTLFASVLGGVCAYILAFSFYEFIANNYLSGITGEQFTSIIEKLREGTFIMTILGAVTPIPYTLVAYGVGFIKGSLFLFILASILGRGFRYALVGFLTYIFGQRAVDLIRKKLISISVFIIVIAIIYFVFKLMR